METKTVLIIQTDGAMRSVLLVEFVKLPKKLMQN
jgi:hypothetical protein